ncbi:hypothetical protein [Pantoea sp. BAV 3049]|uniref:hypothetical protein n=1 Tax=Pantoea sp. BAV 3049 TaxID=2654188 RepID=UPI00351B9959
MRGLFSWAANYSYKLDVNRGINNYSMEQQAQIIADYFILERYGYERWLSERNYTFSYNGPADKGIKEKYKAVLKSFFQQR